MSKAKNLGRLYAWRRVISVWKNSLTAYFILAFGIWIIAEICPEWSLFKEIMFSKTGYILVVFVAVNMQASLLIMKLMERISKGPFLAIAVSVLTVAGPEYIPLFGELLLVMVIDKHMLHVSISLLVSFLAWIGINQKIKKYLWIHGRETEQELLLKRTTMKERNV